ncbi:hypothetical protein [Nocardia jinanensis]|uniref:Phospholipase D-like domain-containing protein n=1 Tax=Nocardia jinanensis TaxID=382504 RepID=A0A917RXW5_9NOCA|nr:hypothetical protein [Nocardia jinanensis]GGL40933.1 hypothetical protein GCM10011588_64660 [Nocardia jinanensis]
MVNGTLRASQTDSVARGIVDPRQLRCWFDRGVHIYLHPWLHAKLIAAELGDERFATVIGSANVSQHSEHSLEEAAVVLHQPEVYQQAHQQIEDWIADAHPLTRVWLDRAEQRFRPQTPRKRPPPEPRPVTLSNERLMISYTYPDEHHDDPVVDAVAAELGNATDPPERWRWPEDPTVDLQIGDTLVLIPLRDDEEDWESIAQHRRTEPPARVLALVSSRGHTTVLYRFAEDRKPTTVARLRKTLPDGQFGLDRVSTSREVNNEILDLFPLKDPTLLGTGSR